MHTWFYNVAGFSIASAFQLPTMEACVIPETTTPDIHIHKGSPKNIIAPTETLALSEDLMGSRIGISGEYFWMGMPGVGEMWVRGGTDVFWLPGEQEDSGGFRTLLVNVLFAIIAHQRGLIPLHLSAVQTGQYAVAFQGESGAGKSTLAIMMMKRKYPLITEDLGIVEQIENGTLMLRPGLPYYRLWRHTLSHIDEPHDGLPLAWKRSRKHYRQVEPEWFVSHPMPLKRIYFLAEPEDNKEIKIKPLQGFDAARALMSSVLFGIYPHITEQQKRVFRQCIEITNHCECFQLIRPKDFEHAEATLDTLEEHLKNLTPSRRTTNDAV